MPAVSPTLSRSMNWSNGAVASNRHCPSALMSARADGGSEQYGMAQPLAEALHPEHRVRVPDEPEDRGHHDRAQRDQQPGAQLGEVVDQRHRRVGIGPAAPTARVEPLQKRSSAR